MMGEELVVVCCSDIAGKVRGKGFPVCDLDKRVRRGVGWTPTNVQITCFDAIADSPYGALGDLVLVPDPQTAVKVHFDDGEPAEHFMLGGIFETDGSPWECCTRAILQAALARLKAVTGLDLMAAFEHEFHFTTNPGPPGSGYTYSGLRAQRRFAETLTAALRTGGITPDTFMKEYGVDQYEVTIAPTVGVRCADEAVIVKELVRITGERLGRPVSFTPLRDPAGVGNGVHIHMSFRDAAGQPATRDAGGRNELTETAAAFVAGILKYVDAIVAITAPSVVSYTRLTPHRWSAAFNNLGFRDREAAVRICPVSDMSDVDKAAQFNFEFRASDAAASPYLQLAALVHAGVQGIEEGLDCPEATREDLSLLDPAALAARGHVRLPQTLEEALGRFEANATVTGWFPGRFASVYASHKRGELAFLEGKTTAEVCALYEQAY
jgi:glutamine synthetase